MQVSISDERRVRTALVAALLLGVVVVGVGAAATAGSGQDPAGQVASDPYEPNDEYTNATQVEPGTTDGLVLTGSPSGQSTDRDWYTVAVAPGDRVTVTATQEGRTDEDISPTVSVYAPGPEGVVSASGGIGEPVSVPVRQTDWGNESVQDGVVYVAVKPDDSADRPFNRLGFVGGGQAPQVRADLVYALNVSVRSGQVATATEAGTPEATENAGTGTETGVFNEEGTTPAASGPGFDLLTAVCALGLAVVAAFRSRRRDGNA
jgi:hypothetical protein